MLKKLFFAVFALFLCSYCFMLYKANTDLAFGGFAIFMDERIFFDGIQNIYNSQNFKEFFLNVIDGKDHRYGRIVWTVYAFTSYIPFLIFGETGQIIATRFTQDFVLIAAFVILVTTFIENFYLRLSAFAILLCLPSTPYYMHMTKPEPLQLLFLAIFLRFALKDGFERSKNWIYLGLSFGAKISVLPYALSLFMLNIFGSKYQKISEIVKDNFRNFLFFLLGLILSVTVLLRGRLAIYIKSTFKSTGHSEDDASVNFLTWLDYIKDDYFYPVFLVVLMVFLVTCTYFLYNFFKENKKNWFLAIKSDKMALLLLGFATLFLPIIFSVKRLWGFYLFTPFVFLFLAFFVMIDLQIKKYVVNFKWRLAFVFYALLIFVALSQLSKNTFKQYDLLSKRSQNIEFVSKKNEYDILQKAIVNLSKKCHKKLKIVQDPRMFTLPKSDFYQNASFSGYFHDYDYGYDFVIMYEDMLDFDAIFNNSIGDDNMVLGQKRYEKAFAFNCKKDCYEKYNNFGLNNVVIFKNKKSCR